ncbi:hypothetical protein ACFO0U_05985 [Chromohalobacter sarecensis]|uniref:Tyrosine specific protein phosphatases domain-containing protein n=1 Tax=Chromohalobacter sarecensis TaxID=245294 RepID=A0ABV9CZ82_9GAMM|nr:hypothetical protein [Chromohalobacter sarecensis]MCK0713597.1 hypothetical protein [Chromohalobacter sarecensis]
MQEVYERVFVADATSCLAGSNEVAVVHACKIPCHQRAVGYTRNLPNSHPNYLVLERGSDLYMNIIDPPVPLFMPALFSKFLEFSKKHWDNGKKLVIHCNQGESRAPSLALLFLARALTVIDDSSYSSARGEFQKLYPRYQPGEGIHTYFTQNWAKLGQDF